MTHCKYHHFNSLVLGPSMAGLEAGSEAFINSPTTWEGYGPSCLQLRKPRPCLGNDLVE